MARLSITARILSWLTVLVIVAVVVFGVAAVAASHSGVVTAESNPGEDTAITVTVPGRRNTG